MHPSSLLSYYPTYNILDQIVSYNNYKKLNIFIDLKNTLQTTYMEHAIVNIIQNSKNTKYIDTSIFSSVVSFLSFHKIYAMKRELDVNFIIFFESGQSSYHKNISKKYKISRKIDDLYGLDREDRELFFNVLMKNFQLIEKALNMMPSVTVIRLPELEADFIPYYLLRRGYIPIDGSVCNITYSNDHDLWQCAADHSYIYSKSAKSRKIIKPGTIMNLVLKKECKIPDIYAPLAMAVLGDPGDDIDGIDGVGPVGFLDIFNQLIALTGSMKEIYLKLQKNEDLFKVIPIKVVNKKLEKVIQQETKTKVLSKAIRLISFEMLTRALDDPDTTEMLDKRKLIEKRMTEKQVTPLESMKTALIKSGVFLEENSLEFLYI
jgi:hypothetical protein